MNIANIFKSAVSTAKSAFKSLPPEAQKIMKDAAVTLVATATMAIAEVIIAKIKKKTKN